MLFAPVFATTTRDWVARTRASAAFYNARRTVPAYREFLREHGAFDESERVRRRAADGQGELHQALAARSSSARAAGCRCAARSSTSRPARAGTASNWVRGAERARGRAAADPVRGAQRRSATRAFVLLNAFALGPWATGMNVSMSLVDRCVLKSIGPDVAKVVGDARAARPEVSIRHHRLSAVPQGAGRHGGHRLGGVRRLRGRRRRRHVGAAARRAEPVLPTRRSRGSARPISRSTSPSRPTSRSRCATAIAVESVARRRPVRPRAVADDLPVRPAQLLDRERRRPQPAVHDQSPRERVAAHPLQHSRSRGRPVGARRSTRRAARSRRRSICRAPLVDLPLLFHWGRQDNAVGFYGCKITPEDIQHVVLRRPRARPNA